MRRKLPKGYLNVNNVYTKGLII